MDGVVCSECGSTTPFPPQPALCHTPFCQGRMGGSDEYVPSRIEATRNMSEPMPGGTGVQGTCHPADCDPDCPGPETVALGSAPDVAGRRQVVDGGAMILNPVRRSPHQDVLLAMPEDHGERKERPICTGLLDYFPAACAEVAHLSLVGNRQHNPGESLHWARGKSTDQPDTIVRHLMQRGTLDSDGVRHSTKVAWRALALLQEEIEREAGFTPGGE